MTGDIYRRVVVFVEMPGAAKQVYWDHAYCTVGEAIARCKAICRASWSMEKYLAGKWSAEPAEEALFGLNS